MKHLTTSLLIIVGVNTAKAQNCGELMEYVKSKSWGTEYVGYNSDAISKVTFYEITRNYQTLYFAVVCFKKEYSFSCAEYIYQVNANT